MKQSPRLHLERLEDRITPDATGTTLLVAPPTTTTNQAVVTTAPTTTTTYTGPTVQQMIDAMNAYLASLQTSGGSDTGLGTGLGGGSSGN